MNCIDRYARIRLCAAGAHFEVIVHQALDRQIWTTVVLIFPCIVSRVRQAIVLTFSRVCRHIGVRSSVRGWGGAR